MSRFLIIIPFMLFLFGCTTTSPSQIGCSVEQTADTAIAAGIAAALNCTNSAQIASDVQAIWGKLNLCQAASVQSQLKKLKSSNYKGPIANVVCPLFIDGLDQFISASGKVPTTWGCSGGGSADGAALAACELIPY